MATAHPVEHHGPDFRLYMVVGVALAVFTAVSFIVNAMVRADYFTAFTGMLIILLVAVCKAVLVGLYFMHLKYDWGKLYFLIIPAFILATMLVVVLSPDIVVAWHKDPYDLSTPTSGSVRPHPEGQR
jgi:cytochrome c oxidase subunit 4